MKSVLHHLKKLENSLALLLFDFDWAKASGKLVFFKVASLILLFIYYISLEKGMASRVKQKTEL
mgnify:CR=1 FL=1